MRTHQDLDVWNLSMELSLDVYRLTEHFSKQEQYGLTSQIRRSCVSIASNIAEGAARQTKKEFVRFLYYARGSSAELETQLELARMLGYLSTEDYQSVIEKQGRISQMLFGLIRGIPTK